MRLVRRPTSHGQQPTTAFRIRLRRIRLRIRRTITPRGQPPAATYRVLPQRTPLRGRLLPRRGLPLARASLQRTRVSRLRARVSPRRMQASRTTLRRRMRARRSNTPVLHVRRSTRPASLMLKASLMPKRTSRKQTAGTLKRSLPKAATPRSSLSGAFVLFPAKRSFIGSYLDWFPQPDRSRDAATKSRQTKRPCVLEAGIEVPSACRWRQ